MDWYHHFRLAQSRDEWSLNPSFLGHEIDVVTGWKLGQHQELQAGYGHFRPGEFVKKGASPSEANWFFLQYRTKTGNNL